jgi:predicted metal-dependent hydrolase
MGAASGAIQRFVQLTLDLFEAVAAPPPGPAPCEPKVQASPSTGVAAKTHPATSRPVRPGLLAQSQSTFHHPSSNREITLDGAHLSYEFKRGRRRTIGFQIGMLGLEVRAPRWVGQAEVDAALREKGAWILRKLAEARERRGRQQSERIAWRDGTSLPFLGEPLLLVLDPRHGFDGVGAALHQDPGTLPGVARSTLHVGLPHTASPAQVRDAVQAWLMRAARERFLERLVYFSERLDVRWRRLSLSSASTRWGSAGADGSISLNWRLIQLRPELIDYVVAHELSHLKVMDHSPRFWRTVEATLPDYARLRAELREDNLPLW